MNCFYVFDTEDFNRKYAYDGDDLGYTWSTKQTEFKLWAPMADECRLILYADGYLGGPYKSYNMVYDRSGVWSVSVKGNINSYYYNYSVKYGCEWNEVADPYAKASGVNGLRCMVVNFEALNPTGWKEDTLRERAPLEKAVIYEGHIRDLTVNKNSGVENKGLFLGLAEKNTVNSYNMPTGLNHISKMGITHLHILPINDFETVDELYPNSGQYNWGYDPKHFSVLEGSYSTNSRRGSVRIKEFKEMVKAIHSVGLNVVLDVVYNHTYRGTDGDLYKVFPGFYYRSDSTGTLTNGSGCGNELATERYMVRKLIVDSLKFWINEYHIDGFRIDLMGLYDIETLRCIREELNKIDPSIILYGEPWRGGNSSLNPYNSGTKENVKRFPDGIAVFSDDIRDAIKGDVFDSNLTGFIHGNINCRESVKMGIVSACEHQDVNPTYFMRDKYFWANRTMQTVNYVSAHDNLTLFDKLSICEPQADIERIKRLSKLCAAIIFTSQGIPFLSEGEEFLRTKNGDYNSYRSGDDINAVDWDRMKDFTDVIEYYKGLIKLRSKHPAFRMTSVDDIRTNLSFIDTLDNQVITYIISNNANGDSWRKIAVIFNASHDKVYIELPMCGWNVVVDDTTSGTNFVKHIEGNIAEVAGISAMVLAM